MHVRVDEAHGLVWLPCPQLRAGDTEGRIRCISCQVKDECTVRVNVSPAKPGLKFWMILRGQDSRQHILIDTSSSEVAELEAWPQVQWGL